MKKILFPFALAAMIFSGCSDDDNAGNGGDNGSDDVRKISVKRSEIDNLPSSTTVSQVRFVVAYNETRDYDLIDATWSDGFSITLPATVSNSYLTKVTDLWSAEDYDSSDVIISNNNALITDETWFEAYNGNNSIGYFYIGRDKDDNEDNWNIRYVYSDRDVTIKGVRVMTEDDDTYQEEVNVTLKQGWNRVAERNYLSGGKYLKEVKTNLPNDLQWYFTTELY